MLHYALQTTRSVLLPNPG